MVQRVEVTGLRELNARLLALPAEIGNKPLKAALRKVGKVVQGAAVRKVRRKTGALSDNIIVAQVRKLPPTEVAVQVTIRAKAKKYKDNARNRKSGRVGTEYANVGPLFYARFLEFGTADRKHKNGKSVGPMPAYPFLRPAFEENKSYLPEMLRTELSQAIDRYVTKYGIKG